MKITVTNEALEWFKNELMLKPGDNVRFFVRYGGHSTIQEGFSLGMNMDRPKEAAVQTEKEGITFFIESEDTWYFKDLDLKIVLNEKKQEIEFEYTEG